MKFTQAAAVQIHLTFSAKWAARFALYSQSKISLRSALRFTGPHFIMGKPGDLEVSVGQSTVNVIVADGTEYIYPLHTVGRVKISNY